MNSTSKIILTLFFATFFTGISIGQQDSTIETTKDSVLHYQGFNPMLKINSQLNEFMFNPDFELLSTGTYPEARPGAVWLQTEAELGSMVSFYNRMSFRSDDLLNPLILKYENDQKLKTLKYILGMAQLSAAGYLAYRHIKKYGFRK